MPRSIRTGRTEIFISANHGYPRYTQIRVYPRYHGTYRTSGRVLAHVLRPTYSGAPAHVRTLRDALFARLHCPRVLYGCESSHKRSRLSQQWCLDVSDDLSMRR